MISSLILSTGASQTSLYNGDNRNWHRFSNMPETRINFAAAFLNDVLYVIGTLLVRYQRKPWNFLPGERQFFFLSVYENLCVTVKCFGTHPLLRIRTCTLFGLLRELMRCIIRFLLYWNFITTMYEILGMFLTRPLSDERQRAFCIR